MARFPLGADPWSVLSPDGQYLAYTSTISEGSSIWRVDLEGGQHER